MKKTVFLFCAFLSISQQAYSFNEPTSAFKDSAPKEEIIHIIMTSPIEVATENCRMKAGDTIGFALLASREELNQGIVRDIRYYLQRRSDISRLPHHYYSFLNGISSFLVGKITCKIFEPEGIVALIELLAMNETVVDDMNRQIGEYVNRRVE
jgi:hypothetical protein